MPKVSVIIPTYNLEKYICETVDSVFAQTYKDYELIIIDDGSTDNTKEVLNKYGSNLIYIYQENRGVAAARNRGIKEAKGEYVALLDADDIWFPDKLMKQVTIAEQNPEINLFFSDLETFNETGIIQSTYRLKNIIQLEKESFRYQIAKLNFNDGSVLKGNFYKDFLFGNLISTPGIVLIRKKCIEEIGFFDESLSIVDDYDLWLRISKKYDFLYLNNLLLKYRQRDDSASGKVNLRNYFYKINDIKVLEKELPFCPESYKSLLKKKILESYKTTIWAYYNFIDLKKVRNLCLGSLHIDIFQIKVYFYLLATFLPKGFLKSRTPISA